MMKISENYKNYLKTPTLKEDLKSSLNKCLLYLLLIDKFGLTKSFNLHSISNLYGKDESYVYQLLRNWMDLKLIIKARYGVYKITTKFIDEECVKFAEEKLWDIKKVI